MAGSRLHSDGNDFLEIPRLKTFDEKNTGEVYYRYEPECMDG